MHKIKVPVFCNNVRAWDAYPLLFRVVYNAIPYEKLYFTNKGWLFTKETENDHELDLYSILRESPHNSFLFCKMPIFRLIIFGIFPSEDFRLLSQKRLFYSLFVCVRFLNICDYASQTNSETFVLYTQLLFGIKQKIYM